MTQFPEQMESYLDPKSRNHFNEKVVNASTDDTRDFLISYCKMDISQKNVNDIVRHAMKDNLK